MRRRNDEWFKNENSSCSRCQVPTRTLIDPAGPLLLSLDDDGDDIEADDDGGQKEQKLPRNYSKPIFF